MANILLEDFTGSNGTQINGFNSWVASATGLQIQSNKAAKTDNGAVWAYKSASGWTGARTAVATFSRYAGAGTRFINYLILGSSSVANFTAFQDGGISCRILRSDSFDSSTDVQVYDGTTLVGSINNIAFDANGADLLVEFAMNADGSGSCKFTQSGVSGTVNWGARTWVNGTGQYHGFYFDHSGSDGTGGVTRSQIDSISLDTTSGGGPTFIPKTVVF